MTILLKNIKTLQKVRLSCGTYFSPAIETINKKINKNNNKLSFNILLIISDGIDDDI